MLLACQLATKFSHTTFLQVVVLQVVELKVMTSCWQNCNKSVELNNLVASCQPAVDNLSTSWEQAVRTHSVDKLLEQHCYKSAAGLLQLVRFTYVTECNRQTRHVKISHLVASLPTNRQQVVFTPLVPSCHQQV
jgi:hypothetical protein